MSEGRSALMPDDASGFTSSFRSQYPDLTGEMIRAEKSRTRFSDHSQLSQSRSQFPDITGQDRSRNASRADSRRPPQDFNPRKTSSPKKSYVEEPRQRTISRSHAHSFALPLSPPPSSRGSAGQSTSSTSSSSGRSSRRSSLVSSGPELLREVSQLRTGLEQLRQECSESNRAKSRVNRPLKGYVREYGQIVERLEEKWTREEHNRLLPVEDSGFRIGLPSSGSSSERLLPSSSSDTRRPLSGGSDGVIEALRATPSPTIARGSRGRTADALLAFTAANRRKADNDEDHNGTMPVERRDAATSPVRVHPDSGRRRVSDRLQYPEHPRGSRPTFNDEEDDVFYSGSSDERRHRRTSNHIQPVVRKSTRWMDREVEDDDERFLAERDRLRAYARAQREAAMDEDDPVLRLLAQPLTVQPVSPIKPAPRRDSPSPPRPQRDRSASPRPRRERSASLPRHPPQEQRSNNAAAQPLRVVRKLSQPPPRTRDAYAPVSDVDAISKKGRQIEAARRTLSGAGVREALQGMVVETRRPSTSNTRRPASRGRGGEAATTSSTARDSRRGRDEEVEVARLEAPHSAARRVRSASSTTAERRRNAECDEERLYESARPSGRSGDSGRRGEEEGVGAVRGRRSRSRTVFQKAAFVPSNTSDGVSHSLTAVRQSIFACLKCTLPTCHAPVAAFLQTGEGQKGNVIEALRTHMAVRLQDMRRQLEQRNGHFDSLKSQCGLGRTKAEERAQHRKEGVGAVIGRLEAQILDAQQLVNVLRHLSLTEAPRSSLIHQLKELHAALLRGNED